MNEEQNNNGNIQKDDDDVLSQLQSLMSDAVKEADEKKREAPPKPPTPQQGSNTPQRQNTESKAIAENNSEEKSGCLTKIFKHKIICTIVLLVLIMTGIRMCDPYSDFSNIEEMRMAYSFAQEAIMRESSGYELSFPKFSPEYISDPFDATTESNVSLKAYTITSYVYLDGEEYDYVVTVGWIPNRMTGLVRYYYDVIREKIGMDSAHFKNDQDKYYYSIDSFNRG